MQMSDYKTNTYLVTAISNMHAGSGDANYGIIDKQVQRDVISELPTINSSSLKGAFRELFAHLTDGDNSPTVRYIFGSDKKESDQNDRGSNAKTTNATKGSYKFHAAHLLVLPVRSDKAPFFRATSPVVLQEFVENLEYFDSELHAQYRQALQFLMDLKVEAEHPIVFEYDPPLTLEDYQAVAATDEVSTAYGQYYNTIKELLGDNVALFHHDTFKALCKELPVIARNRLENGQSVNLWYEEVVPRQSRFYTMLVQPRKRKEPLPDGEGEVEDAIFDEKLAKVSNFVQIGGNASVGYGYAKIQKLEPAEETTPESAQS